MSVCVAAPVAQAHEFYYTRIPNPVYARNMMSGGLVRPCITCHNNPDGGSGCAVPCPSPSGGPCGGTTPCHNAFGMAFRT
ncbi:MAG: hypothetical protein FD127_4408, partial [Acidimicrobiaceae bacterium]